MTCYILTDLYGSDFLLAITIKTLVDYAEENRDNLLKLIVNSHSAMAFSHKVSTIIGRYLKAYDHASFIDGLEVQGSKKEWSFKRIGSEILWGTYQCVTCIPPSLKDLLARCGAQRAG